MVYLYLLLVLFFAYLPLTLLLSSKIIKKKLYLFYIVLMSLQPLSTIVVPVLFLPSLFDGALKNYILLISLYYFIIFLFYCVFLKFIPVGKEYNYSQVKKKSRLTFHVFFVAMIFFSILVYNSNGVFLTNPRHGYQYYREGFGVIWVLYILSVSVLFYVLCIKREINFKKILFFTLLMYLTGSKKLILDVFLKSFLVYLWSGKKIKKSHMIFGGFILILVMLKQFDQYGAAQSFLTRASTYFDFMKLASLVFNDYVNGDLVHTGGSIFLSSFWGYIPRALYSEKPFVYGPVTLVEMYFPGLAETGHTPSFGMVTPEFVDFGWFAPFFAVILNLSLLVQIFALLVIVTRAKLNIKWVVGSLLIVLSPGFGFHFPIIFTLFVAYILLPNIFHLNRKGRNDA